MMYGQVQPSKIILKNKDIITGKILEMKPGEFVRIEVVAGNVLTIPYTEIENIVLDATTYTAPAASAGTSPAKPSTPLGKFYFESFNEAVVGIGVGKMYGLPQELGVVLNEDFMGGFYTANGVGYKGNYFVGAGIGIHGHKEEPDYSISYELDVRCRLFRDKKLSPLFMASTGGMYHEGSLGSYTFSEGAGISIKLKERFHMHVLATHTFVRFMDNLGLSNNEFEDYLSNVYFNYVGLRLGVGFRL